MYKIKKDVFNITKRIKNINRNYELYFNYKNKNFEVHNKYRKPTLVSVLPFKTLNKLTIDYLLKSGKVNEVLKEIETNNKKIQQSQINLINNEKECKLKEIFKYANSGSCAFNLGYENNWM